MAQLPPHNPGGGPNYVRAKVSSFETLPIVGFYVEINLHNKWLLTCSYNPQKGNIKNQLQALCTSFEIYSSQFDHFKN